MPNEKLYISIDDSGDPGIKGACSQNFVLAAVVCDSPAQVKSLSDFINGTRSDLGWSPDAEFKFRKTDKRIVKKILKDSLAYNYSIYATMIDKDLIRNNTAILSKESLYRLATNNLLSLIPFKNRDAKIQLDGLLTKQYQQATIAQLRQNLRKTTSIGKINIKFVDSVDENLIQLADLIAGSINRSIQPTKTDAQVYRNIIECRVAQITNLSNSNLTKKQSTLSRRQASIRTLFKSTTSNLIVTQQLKKCNTKPNIFKFILRKLN